MTPLTQVKTVEVPLSDAQRAWIDRADAAVDREWMADLLSRLVEIPSPYGEETAIAGFLAGAMADAGLDAEVQHIDDRSANAMGRLGAGADGPSVLVFAPLDSPFTGRAEDDVPWVGDGIPDHMRPVAQRTGDGIVGLSAHNPKAHIAAAVAAAKALRESGAALTGAVTLAFGAGGAPANPRRGDQRPRVGHGRGCEFMLDEGLTADFAIVAKPGYRVAWEEVGVCWFRVRVRGTQTYVGRKHLLAYRNPIADAAHVVLELEKWFETYTARHTDGVCAAQGAVGAIEGGWPNMPAFVPAACDILVDMRITPRTTPDEARAELEAELARIAAARPGLAFDCETLVAIPGFATDPDSWIIQSCLRAWETIEGRAHEPYIDTSGQTEAVILRRRGIPTARIGLHQHMGPNAEQDRTAKHSMGAVGLADMERYARTLIRAFVDTCTRTRADVNL